MINNYGFWNEQARRFDPSESYCDQAFKML